MATTTYLELDDQATGANNNTWGDVADANFAILETAIARVLGIATTGGTTTLTSAQNRYPIIRITGTLVSNATINVRAAEKNFIFINATTGNFSVTVKTASGSGKTIPRGRAIKVYCDGTNVELVRFPGIPQAQAGGTVDAITATFEPAFTAAELEDGTLFLVEAAGANTSTTPSFAPDLLTARTITKNGGQALAVGDIRAAGHKLLLCYDASSTRYELLNPYIAPVDLSAYATTASILGKQTIYIPAGAMVPRTTNGAAAATEELATNDVMVRHLAFDATTSEAAQAMVRMPKGWNEGTVEVEFLWKHPSTTTNFGVRWGVRAVAFSDDDAMDASWGTAQEVTDTGGTTADLYKSAFTSALTIGGTPAEGDLVAFEFYRAPADAADTMAVDAHLIGATILYTINAAKDD